MKNIDFNKNLWVILSLSITLVFWIIFSVSWNASIVNLLWYGSNSDYTNPQTTLSWSTLVSTGETLTWATQVTLTAPVQLVSGTINVVIPSGTKITTSSWAIFNATQIVTNTLLTLPIQIDWNEQDVWKIKFWIETAKLNFTKPVKLQIPVSTTASTVTIKVKHFWDTSYTSSALTDIINSNCLNWIANPSTNVAQVANGIATIYTCSASEFVAIIPKVVAISSPSSWGGGWWSSLFMDSCPSGDYSSSYYDRTCWVKPVLEDIKKNAEIIKQIVDTTNTDKKNLTIADKLRYKFIVEWKIKKMIYQWYKIITITWYNDSEYSRKLSIWIINSKKIDKSTKQNYINIINNYIVSKYELELSMKKYQIYKNKYNKNTILLKSVLKKLSK